RGADVRVHPDFLIDQWIKLLRLSRIGHVVDEEVIERLRRRNAALALGNRHWTIKIAGAAVGGDAIRATLCKQSVCSGRYRVWHGMALTEGAGVISDIKNLGRARFTGAEI